MSQELERVYTIPLGKVKLSQSQHRAVRAINMIREFARHHMKVEEIKIEEELAQLIWSKGVRNPPRKVRVRMSKTDEGFILVSQYDEEAEVATPAKDDKKIKDKVEKPAAEKVVAEEPAKEAPKKEEPAKEAPKKEEPAKEAPKKEEPAKETPKKEEPAKEAPKKD
ncbi:MAG: 50S ribosomal protein L31 [Thaumarchaeota archaeon]|nr:50S ribosomal protein L31 [Nitrososphaerota archaeon]